MRPLTHLVAAPAMLLALAGCADDRADQPRSDPPSESPSQTSKPSKSPSPKPKPEEPAGPVLKIVIEGGDVSPNSERIELPRGEPLMLEFRSDRAGELHVHAKPEQFVEFPAGSSTRELVIDIPGLVTVEEHETGDVVAQLAVQ
jgi:glucose/arabinose dehydrogenase